MVAPLPYDIDQFVILCASRLRCERHIYSPRGATWAEKEPLRKDSLFVNNIQGRIANSFNSASTNIACCY